MFNIQRPLDQHSDVSLPGQRPYDSSAQPIGLGVVPDKFERPNGARYVAAFQAAGFCGNRKTQAVGLG